MSHVASLVLEYNCIRAWVSWISASIICISWSLTLFVLMKFHLSRRTTRYSSQTERRPSCRDQLQALVLNSHHVFSWQSLFPWLRSTMFHKDHLHYIVPLINQDVTTFSILALVPKPCEAVHTCAQDMHEHLGMRGLVRPMELIPDTSCTSQQLSYNYHTKIPFLGNPSIGLMVA